MLVLQTKVIDVSKISYDEPIFKVIVECSFNDLLTSHISDIKEILREAFTTFYLGPNVVSSIHLKVDPAKNLHQVTIITEGPNALEVEQICNIDVGGLQSSMLLGDVDLLLLTKRFISSLN